MHSLIRAFACHLNILWLLNYWSNIIWASRIKRRLYWLVWVYACQNATLLEITCHGSFCYPCSVLDYIEDGIQQWWVERSSGQYKWRCCSQSCQVCQFWPCRYMNTGHRNFLNSGCYQSDSLNCIFGNFRENFIFASSIKTHVCATRAWFTYNDNQMTEWWCHFKRILFSWNFTYNLAYGLIFIIACVNCLLILPIKD